MPENRGLSGARIKVTRNQDGRRLGQGCRRLPSVREHHDFVTNSSALGSDLPAEELLPLAAE